MAGSDLEASIDVLYQAPLDRFTAQRNELAASLKKAGDREAADRVKALAKPGVAAWAVNQAWWRDPEALRALLDAGADLRRAHLAFANGKATDIRAAVEARQQAVDAVIDRALHALGGPGKVAPDVRHRIAVTVEALASSGVPDGLAPGRLTADLQASGFEALSALAGIAPSSPAPPPVAPSRPVLVPRPGDAAAGAKNEPPVSKKEARDAAKAEMAAREREQRIAQAEARLAETEANLRTFVAEAKDAAAAEKAAQSELASANEAAEALEAQLEQARERQRDARRAAAQATQAASQAEMSRARAAREVEKSRGQLDEARRS